MHLNNALVLILFLKEKHYFVLAILTFLMILNIILVYMRNEYYAKTLKQNIFKCCTCSYIIF